jgi:glucose-fructose oxidoreductase
VVGLGHIAQTAVLPGLAQAADSRIAALVSDDPTKLRSLSRKYRVPQAVGYDDFPALLASGGIDAVYIALPNHLHHRYALQALEAKVHVLVEKPMAISEAECREMIEAARRNQALLMVAYRLHFEPANLKAVALAKAGRLGELRFFNSVFSMQVTEGDVRTASTFEGGGPLYDLGVYCINAARGLFQAEPLEVSAFAVRNADPRFATCDEMVSALLHFPGERLASFTASFGASSTAAYDLVGTTGSLRLDPAYEYQEELHQRLTIKDRTTEHTYPRSDQFAAEIAYFSRCIRTGTDPEPSGAEGLADVRVVQAILESARTRRPVGITPTDAPVQRPDPRQVIVYPPAGAKPKAIHASQPHR